jgi:hypothetical protein
MDQTPTPRKLTKAEAGRKGGNTTKARHGTEHYRRAGALGFAGLAKARGYFGGSRLGALQWLAAKGKVAITPEDLARYAEAEAWAEATIAAMPDPETSQEDTRHDQR